MIHTFFKKMERSLESDSLILLKIVFANVIYIIYNIKIATEIYIIQIMLFLHIFINNIS